MDEFRDAGVVPAIYVHPVHPESLAGILWCYGHERESGPNRDLGGGGGAGGTDPFAGGRHASVPAQQVDFGLTNIVRTQT